MALQVVFAADLSELFAAASEQIKVRWRDPLLPPAVIFPHPKVEQWFRLEWLKKFGVFANFDAAMLERRLWESLLPAENMRRLQKETLAEVISAALARWLTERDVPADLYRYLTINTDNSGAALAADFAKTEINFARLMWLSGKIAELFIEYENSRPAGFYSDRGGVIENWLRNRPFFSLLDRAEDEIEKWQRELYRRIFMRGGLLERAAAAESKETGQPPRQYLTLPQLYGLRRGKIAAEKAVPLFIFAFSGIGQFHRVLLNEIAQTQDIFAYLFNPCREYWSDIFREKSRPAAQPEKWNEDGSADAPDLLRIFARGGAENISLWCEQADYNCDFIEAAADPLSSVDPLSLLRRVQENLLALQKEKINFSFTDRSLTITPAPTRVREMEFLRAQIWSDLRSDPTLALDDIMVFCPCLEKYRSAVVQVFASGDDALAFDFADYSENSTQTVRALTAFFDLFPETGGEFNRAHFLALWDNSLIQTVRQVSGEEVEKWAEWCEQLNIYRPQIDPQSPHSWTTGLRRLLLGQLSTAPLTVKQRRLLPFANLDTSDSKLIEKFCVAIDELEVFHRQLATNNLEKMLAAMRDFCRWWLLMDSSVADEREIFTQRQVITALDNLRWQIWAGRVEFSLPEMRAALLNVCAKAQPAHGNFLTGGITFAPLNYGRVFPLKYIYLVGMNTENFPAPNPRDALDLRVAGRDRQPRWVGDADNQKQGGYILLEQLHSARMALRISYLGIDLAKDQELFLTAPAVELSDYLQTLTAGKWQIDERLTFSSCASADFTLTREWYRYWAEIGSVVVQEKRQPTTTGGAAGGIPGRIFISNLAQYLGNPFFFQVERVFGKYFGEEAIAELEPVAIDSRKNSRLNAEWVSCLPQFANRHEVAKIVARWFDSGDLPEALFTAGLGENLEQIGERFFSDVENFSGYQKSSFVPQEIRLSIKSQSIILLAAASDLRQLPDTNNYLWLSAKKRDANFCAAYLTTLFLAVAKQSPVNLLAAIYLSSKKEIEQRVFGMSPAVAQDLLCRMIVHAYLDRRQVNFPLKFFEKIPLSLLVADESDFIDGKDDANAHGFDLSAELTRYLTGDINTRRDIDYYPNVYQQMVNPQEWGIFDSESLLENFARPHYALLRDLFAPHEEKIKKSIAKKRQ